MNWKYFSEILWWLDFSSLWPFLTLVISMYNRCLCWDYSSASSNYSEKLWNLRLQFNMVSKEILNEQKQKKQFLFTYKQNLYIYVMKPCCRRQFKNKNILFLCYRKFKDIILCTKQLLNGDCIYLFILHHSVNECLRTGLRLRSWEWA